MLGLMILQQMHDLTDEKAVGDFMFDTRWRYALDVPVDSDREAYVSLKSLWSIRKHLTEDGLYVEMFEQVTKKLAEVFEVDFDKQRLDSVHIQLNMRSSWANRFFQQNYQEVSAESQKAAPYSL